MLVELLAGSESAGRSRLAIAKVSGLWLQFFAAVCVVCVLSGCVATPDETSGSRADSTTSWQPFEFPFKRATRYVPITLDGKPVMTPANAREAYVVLKAPNPLTGYAGCNRLGGRYSLKRGELSFRGAVMTRMACLVEQDTESKLMNALKDTSTWSIEGQYLHLFNDEGQQLARFEAVYLR
jgi:heat shock protein HslJ